MYLYNASELRQCLNFHILKLLFSQYFAGNSDTLSVQITRLPAYMHVLTNFQMYRQNSEKYYDPLLATLVHFSHCYGHFDT